MTDVRHEDWVQPVHRLLLQVLRGANEPMSCRDLTQAHNDLHGVTLRPADIQHWLSTVMRPRGHTERVGVGKGSRWRITQSGIDAIDDTKH